MVLKKCDGCDEIVHGTVDMICCRYMQGELAVITPALCKRCRTIFTVRKGKDGFCKECGNLKPDHTCCALCWKAIPIKVDLFKDPNDKILEWFKNNRYCDDCKKPPCHICDKKEDVCSYLCDNTPHSHCPDCGGNYEDRCFKYHLCLKIECDGCHRNFPYIDMYYEDEGLNKEWRCIDCTVDYEPIKIDRAKVCHRCEGTEGYIDRCDYCDQGYCKDCKPDSFHTSTCEICNNTVCYNENDKCDIALKMSEQEPYCQNCGLCDV